jgi:hypothetical protein
MKPVKYRRELQFARNWMELRAVSSCYNPVLPSAQWAVLRLRPRGDEIIQN